MPSTTATIPADVPARFALYHWLQVDRLVTILPGIEQIRRIGNGRLRFTSEDGDAWTIMVRFPSATEVVWETVDGPLHGLHLSVQQRGHRSCRLQLTTRRDGQSVDDMQEEAEGVLRRFRGYVESMWREYRPDVHTQSTGDQTW